MTDKIQELKRLLWQRWGDPNYPAEWDGREGEQGGKGSQRFWEYLWAIDQMPAINFIRDIVLDVGSGKPCFFKNLLRSQMQCLALDPELESSETDLAMPLERLTPSSVAHIDAITCISVLEHVEDKPAFCSALDQFACPIIMTFEFGIIDMPMVYKCLAAFKNHYLDRMEVCPVMADNSDGKWRPMGMVLRP